MSKYHFYKIEYDSNILTPTLLKIWKKVKATNKHKKRKEKKPKTSNALPLLSSTATLSENHNKHQPQMSIAKSKDNSKNKSTLVSIVPLSQNKINQNVWPVKNRLLHGYYSIYAKKSTKILNVIQRSWSINTQSPKTLSNHVLPNVWIPLYHPKFQVLKKFLLGKKKWSLLTFLPIFLDTISM